MTYLQDKQRKRNNIIIGVGAVLVVFIAFTYRVSIFQIFAPVAGFFSYTFSFITSPFDNLKNNIDALISSKQNLIAENNALKERIAETDALRARTEMLEHDIVRLESISSSSLSVSSGVIARRIRNPQTTLYNTLIIDKGSSAGILPGDIIVGEGGTLLGTIEEVFGTTARGRLFSAPDIESSARIASSSLPLTIQGLGSGTFFARIPQDTLAEVGDVIVSDEYPKWHLGVVSDIERKPQDPFQTLFIKASESPYTLTFVRVVHAL